MERGDKKLCEEWSDPAQSSTRGIGQLESFSAELGACSCIVKGL